MATAVPSNRERFKTFLCKIGSGEHTSSSLSREEAREAMEMMLTGQASSAQIGAFLIAHRLRRPEPQELAGMLDLYHQLGPSLGSVKRTICFGMPFDGRTRTAPIYPLTALVLAAAELPVMLQGGGRMPVKYGVTTMELFTGLGLGLAGLSLGQLEQGLNQHGLALMHQPDHFPLADRLNEVRADLGKRPPVASLELLWTAHRGPHLLVSGFVHPPTEARTWKTLNLAGEADLITVKGLEGSTDLPTSRACVTAQVKDGLAERRIIHPRDQNCYAPEVPWMDLEVWSRQAMEALGGDGPLVKSVIWNAGSYLWMADLQPTHEAGLEKARQLLFSGAARSKLTQLIEWRRNGS